MRAWILGLACLCFIHSSYAKLSDVRTQNRVTPSFNAVHIHGNINVHLHTGYRHSALTLKGDPDDLAEIKVEVIDGVLHLSLKNPTMPYYGPISADIRTHYLNGLEYHGRGTITANHLRANLERLIIDNHGSTTLKGTILLRYVDIKGDGLTQINQVTSRHLHVKLADHAHLQLNGFAALKHLEMKGSSWFSLAWVKTTTLILCASDKARIELAGIVNQFDAQLWNAAKLNARYLRARRAFVKTHDNSIAEISATTHQHTLATEASDIRFYHLPDMKTDFMNFDGAVLDMRPLETALGDEPRAYDDYNLP